MPHDDNTVKITMADILKGIYTANQCCDINDCNIALEQLRNRQQLYPKFYLSIRKRINAIERKLQKTGKL